jgi:hypothetical protein
MTAAMLQKPLRNLGWLLGGRGVNALFSLVYLALATRNLMDDLRSAGGVTRGPPPFAAKDRSAFLAALDLAIVRLKRAGFAVA